MFSIPPPRRCAWLQEVQSGLAVPDPAPAKEGWEMLVTDARLTKLLPSITAALACSAHRVVDRQPHSCYKWANAWLLSTTWAEGSSSAPLVSTCPPASHYGSHHPIMSPMPKASSTENWQNQSTNRIRTPFSSPQGEASTTGEPWHTHTEPGHCF